MKIKVKTLSGREYTLNVDSSDTIKMLKEKAEEVTGIPVIQQRIVFSGKQLADNLSIEATEIQPNSVVHLIVALRG
ncbi:UBIQUITIN-40S ribosomal protein S31 [Anaeramoeba flamelloides]|nr:UBIQUITIN-40S ribosomal protein S31 [Anaeramoeba flamelloides]KAJ3436802.1 UBIQUITIN-40S ribosomal protein S31 [Anaeramoeba flamelloides]KAJ3440195.1 UBIQUITIN-40S ribosomal protein S31 [Anaeramoeba flamelloides]KAJ3444412.1 UBIQUITIN-40S ribosomal protein S31 [Anaeramoeba flamelloides]KAJ3444756.1 UBIQUITIN-40S ribosomal protein S31 [Anaeramoeba flamelloides]